VVATAVSVGMALVSWNVWEKQFLRLKKLFPYHVRARVERPAVLSEPVSPGVDDRAGSG